MCGYVWDNRQQRREVEVANYRESQTYFGAVDCVTGELFLWATDNANGEGTIEFIERLRAWCQGARIVLVWDGAGYHRSQQLRDFLAQLNQADEWQVHCLRFAPYAPQENPIENLWEQANRRLRQMHQRCCSFKLI
ncbi:MAG: transposase [Cyanobacteria bacterium J06642_12]